MIRMGRSNPRPETAAPHISENANHEADKIHQSSGFPPPQNSDNSPFRPLGDAGKRAFTESEGLARDIKEGRLSGYVGVGTTLMGETEFKSLLRVDGHLVGKIMSHGGTLQIGASGLVDANVRVATAAVNGTVNGDIFATERIEIGRTGKVVGNIQTPSLVIEQGAILEGNCTMLKAKADSDKLAAQAIAETANAESELLAANQSKITIQNRLENAAASVVR